MFRKLRASHRAHRGSPRASAPCPASAACNTGSALHPTASAEGYPSSSTSRSSKSCCTLRPADTLRLPPTEGLADTQRARFRASSARVRSYSSMRLAARMRRSSWNSYPGILSTVASSGTTIERPFRTFYEIKWLRIKSLKAWSWSAALTIGSVTRRRFSNVPASTLGGGFPAGRTTRPAPVTPPVCAAVERRAGRA